MKRTTEVSAAIYDYRTRLGLTWEAISIDIEEDFCVELTSELCESAFNKIKASMGKIEMPVIDFDLDDKHITNVMKKVQFIDIETSLIEARVFRTGKQGVNANQLTTGTKILTVAGGSMFDLYTKGAPSIWGVSNHHDAVAFAKDPLDDTYTLRKVWSILDSADTIVAHNARFDRGWLEGRFLELGWKLPSTYKVVCTYQNLHRFNMTSKKLMELSKKLVGTEKIHTDFDLWMRCSDGEVAAFKEMLKYNKGDIYDTLFKVYLYTCRYNPTYSVDMSDGHTEIPQCMITGEPLVRAGSKLKNNNGLTYRLYVNPTNGVEYIDRYNTKSGKSGLGLVRHNR